MKNNLLLFIFFIFIFFLYIHIINKYKYIESINGIKIYVYEDSNKKAKLDLLYKIINNMFILKKHLNDNILNFPEYKNYITQLNNNFNDKTYIYETNPNSDLTAYSVNKGQEFSICLISKKTGKIHDINLLMYVVIHEMSHFACPEIGHGDLFKKIFKKFTEESIKIGIYNKVDYSITPQEYCGLILNSTIV
jgi:hypothetical protein